MFDFLSILQNLSSKSLHRDVPKLGKTLLYVPVEYHLCYRCVTSSQYNKSVCFNRFGVRLTKTYRPGFRPESYHRYCL